MSDDKRAELHAKAKTLLASDHFAALGVSRAATSEEVKRAFLALAKNWHPDRVPAGLEDLRGTFTTVFARLEEARVTLMDPARRIVYVDELAVRSKSKTALAPGASTAAELEFRKAEVFLKKNDLAQAETHALEAVKLAPANADYAAMLVWVRASKPNVESDKVRGFVAELDKIIHKSSQCERALFYRGMLRKRLDLIPQAMSDLAKAAELNPHNIDAAREVRLYRMRQERDGEPPQSNRRPLVTSKKPTADDADGVGGFLKKLLKRD